MKNLNNLKHKELYEWYENQPSPKSKRAIFSGRVLRYDIPKEEAIKDKSFLSEWKLKRFGSIVKDNWRVCTHCNEFKERDKFAKSRTWYNWYTCNCKECRNKMKADYRMRTNYAKDHEYKLNKRNLKQWDQIYFQDDIREVVSYKMKKWYLVKSILNGAEKRISTGDNHYRQNNICVRYRKLQNLLKVKTKEEIKRAEELKEELSVNENLWER